MITISELRSVPLFANVADRDLEILARNVADIRVQPSEYIEHEGEGRALIIVIEGKCEVTKLAEGIERVVGARGPGELFGEVPLVLNTPFLASLRAVEPSRVIRVEPRDFHVLAAAYPDVSATVGALALERIEGLHDLKAQPPP